MKGYAQWGVLAGTYLAKCIDVDKTRVNLKIWDTVRQLFAHAVDASSADVLRCLYGIDPCSAALHLAFLSNWAEARRRHDVCLRNQLEASTSWLLRSAKCTRARTAALVTRRVAQWRCLSEPVSEMEREREREREEEKERGRVKEQERERERLAEAAIDIITSHSHDNCHPKDGSITER